MAMMNEEDDKSPQEIENSKKRKLEKNPDEEDPEVKWRKDFESWEDLEDLMRVRIPRRNCRTRDEGLLDLFADVWQEI